MTCAQVLPTRFALGSHTKTADQACNRWSRTYGSFLSPIRIARSSVPPVFLGKALRLIGTSFPVVGPFRMSL